LIPELKFNGQEVGIDATIDASRRAALDLVQKKIANTHRYIAAQVGKEG
jgi:hypothetical protein